MRSILIVLGVAIGGTASAQDVSWKFGQKKAKDSPYVFSEKKVTPEVVTQPTFQRSTVQYNASHRCPAILWSEWGDTFYQCGSSQYSISGRGPLPGTHTHTCSRCGTTWYH